MTSSRHTIEHHYTTSNLLERIFGALVMAGKDPFALTIDDLAAIDEFHTGGRNATVELAELANPQSSDRVLDVGCGLGGSARFLASQFGCRVTGIDLTPEYIKVATRLTELVGLNHKVAFLTESALQLPFDDESFDVVWTEHAQMNVQDKRAMYMETSRVLRPGGRFVFHDVFTLDEVRLPTFPLPWANTSQISFLCTAGQMEHHLHSAGLNIQCLEHKSEEAIPGFQAAIRQFASGSPPPLGIHVLMGNSACEKITNYLTSLENGTTTVAMGLAIKPK